ncbi:hypothetical protein [Novosphingobium sp. B1]|uniref:hypothetical protein n=1 Tax=Novosphingobium sp. B1 TaxID=1938756 RepID=UPI0009D82D1B|nr:hypothetical protein [Novosphingobium sp. B1]SMC68166.1 hypothetical protein SAMN06272759_105319 [Novosphingobium sp. B1]
MSMHIAADHIEHVADIVEQPHHTVVDRNFGLPGGLYAVSAGGYLAFIAMMASIFGNSELAIPMVIFVMFIACAFGIPAVWTRLGADRHPDALGWYDFRRRGIQTLSGKLDAGSAMAQVLILPVLIAVWGLAIAIIVATVR